MKENYAKLTSEQADTAFDFIKAVKGDDVNLYWEFINKIDQARVYGMYRSIKVSDENFSLSFLEYVKEYFMKKQAEIYEALSDSPGISQTLRMTDERDYLVYLFKDVKVPIVYIAETEAEVWPLVMTVDIDMNVIENQLDAKWKVRIYQDKFHQTLSESENEFSNI